MLRAFVLVLLLLNGVFFAWGQGWLLAFGVGPTPQREPQRLTQQIHPEAISLINERDLVKLQAATPVPPPPRAVCLQSGVFDEAKANAVRSVLQAGFAPDAWALDEAATPERWIIYMGKFANAADLAKKRAQLAGLHLTFEPLSNSALAPGLSLGAFESQAQATAALEALASRGVRTARVVQESPAGRGYRLRLPTVDDALQKQLPVVRAALAGQALTACTQALEPR